MPWKDVLPMEERIRLAALAHTVFRSADKAGLVARVADLEHATSFSCGHLPSGMVGSCTMRKAVRDLSPLRASGSAVAGAMGVRPAGVNDL